MNAFNSSQKATGICALKGAPEDAPDYTPESVYGRLVSLEGDARRAVEIAGELEIRLKRFLSPQVPAPSSGKVCPESLSPSAAGHRIECVRAVLHEAIECLTDIIHRLDA